MSDSTVLAIEVVVVTAAYEGVLSDGENGLDTPDMVEMLDEMDCPRILLC